MEIIEQFRSKERRQSHDTRINILNLYNKLRQSCLSLNHDTKLYHDFAAMLFFNFDKIVLKVELIIDLNI